MRCTQLLSRRSRCTAKRFLPNMSVSASHARLSGLALFAICTLHADSVNGHVAPGQCGCAGFARLVVMTQRKTYRSRSRDWRLNPTQPIHVKVRFTLCHASSCFDRLQTPQIIVPWTDSPTSPSSAADMFRRAGFGL